jgi:hypothetical protein
MTDGRGQDPLARYTSTASTTPTPQASSNKPWWQKAANVAGNIAYDITGADNYAEAWRKSRQGNWWGAAGNLAMGLGESALLALPAAGTSTKVGRLVANRLPFSPQWLSMGPKKGLTAAGGRVAGFSAGEAGVKQLTGEADYARMRTPEAQPQQAQLQYAGPDEARAAAAAGRAQTGQTGDGFGYGPDYRGNMPAQGAGPDPRDPLSYLSATQKLEFEMALRDLGRDTEAMITELQGAAAARRKEAERNIQRTGREGAGSSQELASALAEAGVDTSPGQFDVGLEDISQRTALAQAEQRRSLAEYISGVQGRISSAERAAIQREADIELARAAAIQDAINASNQRSIKVAGGR